MHHITAIQLAEKLAESAEQGQALPMLLDVREPAEWEICHIAGSQLMPMQSLPTRLNELDPAQEIICICHHGMRSAQVGSYLERQGFENVVNLTGGIDAWASQIDPRMRRY